MVLLQLIGANPEEQQRLRMLGALEAQNVKVSRQSLPCPHNHLLIPFRMLQDVQGGVKTMLHENGIPERVVEHWHHMAELGEPPPLPPFPPIQMPS